MRSGRRTTDRLLVDFMTVSIATLLAFFRTNGGKPTDLRLAWIPWNDLFGWYVRALALSTNGTPDQTAAIGYPGVHQSGMWGTLGLDGFNLFAQWIMAEVGIGPVLATNTLVIGSLILSSAMALYLFRKLEVSRLLQVFGSILISTLPFTFLRFTHLNIAFAWPYVSMILVVFALLGMFTIPKPTLVILGLLIGGSGSYALLYSLLATFGALLIVQVLPSTNLTNLKRSSVYVFIGLLVSSLLYLATLRLWPSSMATTDINSLRSLSEATLWQGWSLSLFVPGPFSGVPLVSGISRFLNTTLFVDLDKSSLCLASWTIQSDQQDWHCRRLVESLSFNSVGSLIGNWMILVCVLSAISKDRFQTLEHFVGGMTSAHRKSLEAVTSIWLTVLLTNSFGFGLVIFRLFPGARTWGRMYLISSICAIIVFILVINQLNITVRRRYIHSLTLLLLLALLVDQSIYSTNSLSSSRPTQRVYAQFAEELSRNFPSGCPLVLFPSQRYASVISSYDDGYFLYNDISLALYAPQYRWSTGESSDARFDVWPVLDETFKSEDQRHSYFRKLVSVAARFDVCGFVVDKSRGSGVSEWDESFLEDELLRAGFKFTKHETQFLSSIELIN